MTQPQRHIVRRVVLEIENTATEAEQTRLQAQIAAICRRRLSAWLDKCCNQWSTPEQLKQIDRLEIDIPNVDLNNLDHVWTTQVEPRLEAALKKILQSTKQATQNKVQNVQEDLLRFFLQNGSLPWWADGQDKTLLQTAFLHLLKPESRKEAEQLRAFVLQNPVALQRLLYHFKDTILLEWLEQMTPSVNVEFEMLDFGTLPKSQIPNPTSYVVAVSKILALLSQKSPLTVSQRLEYWTTILSLSNSNQSIDAKIAALNALLGKNEAQRFKQKAHLKSNTPIEKQQQNVEKNINLKSNTLIEKQQQDVEDNIDLKSNTSKFNQSDTLYLYNAGLILLAPFLPQLFEGLGWIQDKQFTDKDKTQLAVQLLQFLCDGQDEPPEYQLTLNKILCGLHPQALYTPERLLLETEKEQAEALLQAVIEHAAALGLKTSDALRGSFLLRKGTLESAGTHWLLRVETETWDILLPRIPWNYEIVKLPWMEVPIYVEWEVN